MSDQEQALKDAVVEAALQMEGSVQIVCQNPTAPAKFIGALEALRLFRAPKAEEAEPKSFYPPDGGLKEPVRDISECSGLRKVVEDHFFPKAEEVPARCEPPADLGHERFHWLDDRGTPFPAMWCGNTWSGPASDTLTPEEAANFGWKYLSPAKPLPTEQEPSDNRVHEFIREFRKTHRFANEWDAKHQMIKDALRTFKPLPAEIEVSDAEIHELGFEWAGVARSDPIFEKSVFEFTLFGLRKYTEAALAKFSTPKAETPRLADLEIQKLAKFHCSGWITDGTSGKLIAATFEVPDLIKLIRAIESKARGEA